ncbi:MAG: hypothetical protein ACRDDY_03860 [Clostridium sp.]
MTEYSVSNKTSILLLVFLFCCTFIVHKMPKNVYKPNTITMINKSELAKDGQKILEDLLNQVGG